MKPLSGVVLMLLGTAGLIVGAALSFVMLRLAYAPPMITPWLALLFLLIAVAVLAGGRGVRKLKRRQETRVTYLDAARIALFARSAALNGAVFSGFFGGILLVSLFRTWAPATVTAAWGSGAALVGAGVLTVTALIVERWCIDDEDEDGKGGTPGGRSGHGLQREDPSPAAYTVTEGECR